MRERSGESEAQKKDLFCQPQMLSEGTAGRFRDGLEAKKTRTVF